MGLFLMREKFLLCGQRGVGGAAVHLLSSLLLSSLELSDTRVYEPYTRALLGTASRLCEVGVLESRTAGYDVASYHTVEFEGFVGYDFRTLRDQVCMPRVLGGS